MYIFDTNSVIYFLGSTVLSESALIRLDQICETSTPHISIITRLELLGFNFSTEQNENQAIQFIARSKVHQIDQEIDSETIRLRKEIKIKLPDAIIAATAISKGLTLITGNIADFKPIERLSIVNPFEW